MQVGLFSWLHQAEMCKKFSVVICPRVCHLVINGQIDWGARLRQSKDDKDEIDWEIPSPLLVACVQDDCGCALKIWISNEHQPWSSRHAWITLADKQQTLMLLNKKKEKPCGGALQKGGKTLSAKCSSAGNNHPPLLSLHNCLETTNSGWPENYLPSGSALQSLSEERCTVSSLSQAHYT